MKIRITGKRKLPKAQVGLNQSCPEGKVFDEETGQCVEGYWDPITHSIVKSGELSDAQSWEDKENPFINNPFFSNLSKSVGERSKKEAMGLSTNPWKSTGVEGLGSSASSTDALKPKKKNTFSNNVRGFINTASFANDYLIDPSLNTAGLIASQIEQNKIGKAGERKRRMLDLNEYSLPVTQTRMGNFTSVVDSGLFDPRNTGFKSEGMATNPFYAPTGRSMAIGGELDSIMPHAQPMQLASELVPPGEYAVAPTNNLTAPSGGSSATGHKFAPEDRKYNKNTIINTDEITFLDAPQMNVDKVLDVLASNEKSSTGAQTNLRGPQGQKASAMGRWGITSGTRRGIYEKNFKDQMSIQEFEAKYNSDPNFERTVAKKLVEEMLPKYGSLIFGAWYYPEYAEKYLNGDTKVLNMIPREDYGNAITWGGYLKKAQDKYFKLDNSMVSPDFLSDATNFAKQFNFDITSTTGDKHNTGSKHYQGKAIDVRTRNKNNEEIAAFMEEARKKGYRVLDERQRPAGQAVWSGPHLHLESQKLGGQNNKTMKIRIVSGPNQKMAYGGQSGYGLNLGQRDVYTTMNKNSYENSSRSIGPVPRDQANIEAEKGETVYGDINNDGQNEHMIIGGKRHTQGGTPLNVPEGSFIFSDTKKMVIKDESILKFFGMKATKAGHTPAEIAKKYDVNRFRAVLENPQSDVVQKRTAQRMIENYEAKLGYLALIQESMKDFPQGIPEIAEKIIETPLGQQIAGEYLQQEQEMMMQQQAASQANAYSEGAPEEVLEEEMMQGQEAPMEEGMQQMMPPMQRYGGGMGYYAEGGYIPEDLGVMAYGGYAPLQTYQTAGQVGPDLTKYNLYSKAVVTKQNGATIIKYPDGEIRTIFPNGRMKVQYSDGTSEMTEVGAGVPIDIVKGPGGTPVLKLSDGSSIAYFSNGRAQYIYPDGTKTMGTVVSNGIVNWEDEEDEQSAAPATTTPAATSTAPAGTTSAPDPNDPYTFTPYAGDKYGKYAATGSKSNASNFSKKEWIDKLTQLGFKGPWTEESIQDFLYENPDARTVIDEFHGTGPKGYGMPNAGKPKDKILGVRWDDALKAAIKNVIPPDAVQTTPGTPAATGAPVFQCVDGVVSQVADADRIKGQTYYLTASEAEAACKPAETVTETTPNEFEPVGSDIPYGKTRQDVRNIGAANLNASLIKRFVAPRMNVNPQFAPFVAQDPRFKVATRQAQFNMMNNALQQYGSPQSFMANSSLAAGRTGEGAAQDIANTNEYNVTGYNQKLAQDAAIANQFAMYNAQNALTSRQEDQSNESKYLKALGQGYDRITAAKNQADTNAAMYAGLNATSPYFYYNPWDQNLRFNSDEARAAYFNNLKNPDAYNQTEQDRRYALYKKYRKSGESERAALSLSGVSGGRGYSSDSDYEQEPKKTKKATTTPTQRYGGYIMSNPFLK